MDILWFKWTFCVALLVRFWTCIKLKILNSRCAFVKWRVVHDLALAFVVSWWSLLVSTQHGLSRKSLPNSTPFQPPRFVLQLPFIGICMCVSVYMCMPTCVFVLFFLLLLLILYNHLIYWLLQPALFTTCPVMCKCFKEHCCFNSCSKLIDGCGWW